MRLPILTLFLWNTSLWMVCNAFVPQTHTQQLQNTFLFRSKYSTSINEVYLKHNNDVDDSMDKDPSEYDIDGSRRTFLGSTTNAVQAMIATSTLLGTTTKSFPANAEDSMSATTTSSSKNTGSVVVIGANGKTGTECVKALSNLSIPTIATSRSGTYTDEALLPAASKSTFETMVCDVTQPSTITPVVQNAQAVIFAASASKQGGTPAQVDNVGLVSIAKACIDANVSKLVIVSSGAVTKPSSPVYLFLNLFGKIMEEKIKGEDTVRAIYAANEVQSKNLSYTIIRPGGLTEEIGLGVSALELNQGDTKSGRIARADVAQLCVQSILNPKLTEDVTFECYNKDTAAPLATVGASNIMKAKTNEKKDVFISGRECVGSTWEEIFQGLERD